MKRKYLLPVLLLVAVLSQTACPRPQLITYARTAVSALREVMPILQGAGLPITRVQQAVAIGDRLITALTAKDNPTAVEQTALLITAFEAIVNDVNLIHDQRTKTLILVALAVGNIALHHIADVLSQEAAKAPMAMRGRTTEVGAITDFRRKPQWRCRSAVSGQFQKMEFCKKNPATSVVETY